MKPLSEPIKARFVQPRNKESFTIHSTTFQKNELGHTQKLISARKTELERLLQRYQNVERDMCLTKAKL